MNYKFLPYPPTTKTPGNEGDYYIDTAASVLYMCKGCNTVEETTNFVTMTLHPSFDTVEYVWEEQSGGGSSGYIYSKLIERSLTGTFVCDDINALGEFAFAGCDKLEVIDLPLVDRVYDNSFVDCSSLTALILREYLVVDVYTSNVMGTFFTGTPIESGNGYIYVPSEILDAYKTDENWSNYTNKFRAIEDYPEICGGEQ